MPRTRFFEAQRITRRLQLVRPLSTLGIEGGAPVLRHAFAGWSLETTNGARDELAPVVGEVESFARPRLLDDRHGGPVPMKVDATGQTAPHRQVRREPLAGAAVADGDAAISLEVVLGVFGDKHAILAAFRPNVAGICLHFRD